METISLKSLAHKVLQGNVKGNSLETEKKIDGNFIQADGNPLETKKTQKPLPYVTDYGSLVIPWNSHPRYHYWKPGGQSLCETLKELGRCDLIPKYKSPYSDN